MPQEKGPKKVTTVILAHVQLMCNGKLSDWPGLLPLAWHSGTDLGKWQLHVFGKDACVP